MKITLYRSHRRDVASITVQRLSDEEPAIVDGDTRYEHRDAPFWHKLARALNQNGFVVQRTLMREDGHEIKDNRQYLSTPKLLLDNISAAPHIYVWDTMTQHRSLVSDYNYRHVIHLVVSLDVARKQPDCWERFGEREGTFTKNAYGNFVRMGSQPASTAPAAAGAVLAGSAPLAAQGGTDPQAGGHGQEYPLGRGRRIVRPHRQRPGKEGDHPRGGSPQDADRDASRNQKLRGHRLAGNPRGDAPRRLDAAVAASPKKAKPAPKERKQRAKPKPKAGTALKPKSRAKSGPKSGPEAKAKPKAKPKTKPKKKGS